MAHRTKFLTSLGSAQVAFAEPSKVNLSRLAYMYISACGIIQRLIELFHLCGSIVYFLHNASHFPRS